jgi:hypothetical protein
MMADIIPFPLDRARFTAEIWVTENPRWRFVRSEDRTRPCSMCKKRIVPGEEYYGTYAIQWSSALNALMASGEPERFVDRASKVEIRLDRRCAAGMRRALWRASRNG